MELTLSDYFLLLCSFALLVGYAVYTSQSRSEPKPHVKRKAAGRNEWFAWLGSEWVLRLLVFVAGPIWLVLLLAFVGGTLVSLMSVLGFFDPAPNLRDLLFGSDARLKLLTLAAMSAGLSALVAFPFTIIRIQQGERQTREKEDGLITDRINKAVENLGAEKTVKKVVKDERGLPLKLEDGAPLAYEESVPNKEVRIGGLYALQRIAEENPDWHLQIIRILCAYIRENAPAGKEYDLKASDPPPVIRDDIQIALTVLGERSEQGKKLEYARQERLNLRSTDLSGADFSKLDFTAADFSGSTLIGPLGLDAVFDGARFQDCLIARHNWGFASFVGADFQYSRIGATTPFGAIKLGEDSAKGIVLRAVVAEGSAFNCAEGLSFSIGTQDTVLKPHIDRRRADLPWSSASFPGTPEHEKTQQELEADATIAASGFRYWSPFDSQDLTFGTYLPIFRKAMGQEYFPFTDKPPPD